MFSNSAAAGFWLIPQPAIVLSACLPPSTTGFDMEIQPEEPGKPLKRDSRNEGAGGKAESIKANCKILNLTTTGLRGDRVKDKRRKKRRMQ